MDASLKKVFDAQERRVDRQIEKLTYRQQRARDGRDLERWASHLLGEGRTPPGTGFGHRGTVRGVAGVAGFQRA